MENEKREWLLDRCRNCAALYHEGCNGVDYLTDWTEEVAALSTECFSPADWDLGDDWAN